MDDWDRETVLRKPKARATVIRNQSELNAAARQGAIVETLRASNVANKAHHVDTDHRRIAQLDRSDDVKPPEKVNLSVSQAMRKARADKGWSQKELATKINEKESTVKDYEGGHAIPVQQILVKIERQLGVKLQGKKDIGMPLPARGSAKGKAEGTK
ncbi:multiprotein-bridging factor 1 [Coemansia sp. RSA 2671]|uniref:Multiprotein-bridging factor 1 n=1 Tax=Coemansia linderi TaxID=2663919 RepID=A0ACC1KQE6_9FUNG|nr:multiprotein-bridging factor 1 [Coemansia sp. RSA 2675]KAJ2338670.1 multiprotein-bridging factor 1 [Coemansia sp. RSA 2671]KAJ2701889.1 multiprotein-bridging factor 1 [Coemansia sp. IMI 209128]KAJ2792770.1 multiprotein-bridging factor 1 [Coemansia linderi]